MKNLRNWAHCVSCNCNACDEDRNLTAMLTEVNQPEIL